MKEYKVGEYHNFRVTGVSSTNNRLYLKDDDGRAFSAPAFDFQTEWDAASPQVSEETVRCYVKEVTDMGIVTLRQSKEFLFYMLYPEAMKGECKDHQFVVVGQQPINDTLFYVVRDAYGITHLFKPSPSYPTLHPGDEVRLNVTGYKAKEGNRSYLYLSEMLDEATPTVPQPAPATADDDTPVGEFGEEDDTHEFKSTIIYPAGAVGADIDTQMMVIVKTIAGFMNAAGGTLYIGVNDNGEAVGIENEYAMLNASTKDPHHYQENKDGYENKLRSAINALLSAVANDYVSITFSKHCEHTVCEVQVKAASSVIWYNKRDAYKRLGNRTSHLREEAINKLVLDKSGATAPPRPQPAQPSVDALDDLLEETLTSDAEPENEPQTTKVATPAKILTKGEEIIGKGSFYMNLFANGDWSWSKDVPTDDDLEFCVPINAPASKNDLIMVYADGCVNRVDAYHLHLNKTQNKRYMNGRRTDGMKLLKAFHATADDLLACLSMQDGHPYVKVHPVSHVSRHDNISLMGNRLINVAGMAGVEMTDICFVAAEHSNRVSTLFKTENQKTNSLGFQMDLARNEAKRGKTVMTLRKLCDVPAQMNSSVL